MAQLSTGPTIQALSTACLMTVYFTTVFALII